MLIDRFIIKDEDKLGGAPSLVTKSDTAHCVGDNGRCPRGYIIQTGGTLTVWVEDPDNAGNSVKRDLGSVADGFTWVWGGVLGIALTTEAGEATTCAAIIAIP